MPNSLSVKSDGSGLADSADRDGAGVPAEGASVEAQRVRELPPPPRASDLPPEAPEIEADADRPGRRWAWWSRTGRRQSSSCLVSFVFHFLLLLGLGLAFETVGSGTAATGLILDTSVPEALADGLRVEPADVLPTRDLAAGDVLAPQRQFTVPDLADLPRRLAAANHQRPVSSGMIPVPPSQWLLRADGSIRGALDGRSPDARARLAGEGGGSPESERAVERGLKWLMAHQRDDGSWHFDLHKGPCRGQCRDPGTESSTTAATSLALLPFLGAGYTHTRGEYQDVVRRGLYHLMNRTLKTAHGYDLQEGTMYAQGLATIALCEAYAMTDDPALEDVGQGAIRFIAYAQDGRGGGWRYSPGEPGDMTVTGWQLMGLKSGQVAGLDVPRPTVYLVHRFLDSVQSENGALYAYMPEKPPGVTTTAIGLLCRMYTGWQRDHPGLREGVARLDQWGPSDDDLYYNYYAAQVMRHWEGPEWERWNSKMRDYLVSRQATTGHEAGSWHFSHRHGDIGGRLYSTAMAVMILEVYYRHMPIYRQDAVEQEL